jgi:hypothetical protein
MSSFVAVKTRVKASRERKSPEKEDVTISEGCFWYIKPQIKIDSKTNRRSFYGINQKEMQRLRELVKSNFFSPEMLSVIANMNEESGTKKQTRLRSFDWAVTNFTKGNPISYLRPVKSIGANTHAKKEDEEEDKEDKEDKEEKTRRIVDPHVSYSSELHSGHRLLFDPFRRGTHVYFEADGQNRHSTVGQLCFLKWCFDNGIDKYVDENADEIKKDMAVISKKRRKNKKTPISIQNQQETKRSRDEDKKDEDVKHPKKRSRMELTPTPKSRIRGLVPMTKIEIHA